LTGIAFISIAIVGEAFNYFFLKRNPLPGRLLKHFAIAALASYVAILINPYGIDYHIGIVKSLITKEYMSYATQVYAWVDLWRYLFPKGEFAFRFVNTAWALLIIITTFCVLSIYLFLKKKFFDITVILLNLVFFYQGMGTARVTIFPPLIWIFSMLYIMKKADACIECALFINLIPFIFKAGHIIQMSAVNLRIVHGLVQTREIRPVKEVEFSINYPAPYSMII
jgi:hypothetical protein